MAQVEGSRYSESRRMELKSLVHLAGEIISYYWPMGAFVHHNPLHGLEDLPFEEGVRRGQRRLGGRGYVDAETFCDYFRAGRIQPRHLDLALRERALSTEIKLGAREITHLDVLRACLLGQVAPPARDALDSQLARHPDRKIVVELADILSSIEKTTDSESPMSEDSGAQQLGTMASRCDRVLGTEITEQINREIIKWCEAFLDEGHATWAMPGREKGFYVAWKFLAQQ